MSILDRYVVRAILGATALVMAVLMVLALVFSFIGEQGDIGQGRYSAYNAMIYCLLNLPLELWELLPIAALIGSLVGLGALARGSELIVIRTSGVSVLRVAGSALIAGLVLLALEVLVGELIAPQLAQTAKQQKAFERFSNVSFGSGGAWARDRDRIFNVEQLSGAGQFGGMLVFELSPAHRLVSIGHAARATVAPDKSWQLSDYSESRFQPERVDTRHETTHDLSTDVSAAFLTVAMTAPRELTAQALWSLIEYDRTNALDPRAYVFAFWSRVARTVAIALAVLLAVPFVLGPLRSAGAGSRMLVGLLLGVGFFLLQRLIESGTVVFDLDPLQLAWLPTALLAVVTVALLARAR